MTEKFDYYYGTTEKNNRKTFQFYKLPKELIKDKNFKVLSSDAKLLYSLMLDRMSLSIKNGWIDKENRVYIYYKVKDIMEDLGCASEKCMKIIAELDSKKGIGLIEKKRQGFGKPDIIYVKNLILSQEDEPEKPEELEVTQSIQEQQTCSEELSLCENISDTKIEENNKQQVNYNSLNEIDIESNYDNNESKGSSVNTNNDNGISNVFLGSKYKSFESQNTSFSKSAELNFRLSKNKNNIKNKQMNINNLVCTTTLMQGVNLPTQNVSMA